MTVAWECPASDDVYAAGSAAASAFGPAYPGGDATLGPAMAFGRLAAGTPAGGT
jgi:hypothetical protein